MADPELRERWEPREKQGGKEWGGGVGGGVQSKMSQNLKQCGSPGLTFSA